MSSNTARDRLERAQEMSRVIQYYKELDEKQFPDLSQDQKLHKLYDMIIKVQTTLDVMIKYGR